MLVCWISENWALLDSLLMFKSHLGHVCACISGFYTSMLLTTEGLGVRPK